MTDGWNTFALPTAARGPAGLRQPWWEEWILHCGGGQLAATTNLLDLALNVLEREGEKIFPFHDGPL